LNIRLSPLGLFFSGVKIVLDIPSQGLTFSDMLSEAVGIVESVWKAKNFTYLAKQIDILSNINSAWNCCSFIGKLPDDKIKTYKNMYRITVNICSEETETSFQGTYYFDSKSKVYIQDEKMLNSNGNINAKYNYGKYTYSPISSLTGSNRYWMKIGNGDYVQSGGI
jgi:hypothetical protein